MTPIKSILDHVRTEPSRTWSIIMTIYGDAIVPRGGSVWLGTLLAFFAALDIAEGVVRTAASRLTGDGWLERRRVGRNSFYRLAPKGAGIFQDASARIYTCRSPAWAGYFDLVLPARGAVRPAGLGAPAAGVWVAPGGADLADLGPQLRLRVSGDSAANQGLAARSWPLEATAASYEQFNRAFAPLQQAMAAGQTFDDQESMLGRILLIHAYRRIILRDPLLPSEILPAGWPGTAARALCAAVYQQLLPGAERWLDAHGIDEAGARLPANPEIYRRFAD